MKFEPVTDPDVAERNKHAVGLYVDLRLGMRPFDQHSPMEAEYAVEADFGAPAARAARRACSE